jgi:hypothetical protein
MDLRLIDVLIEAETQFDWASDPDSIERALLHLREVEPQDELVQRLQAKLLHMRLQNVHGRIVEH